MLRSLLVSRAEVIQGQQFWYQKSEKVRLMSQVIVFQEFQTI